MATKTEIIISAQDKTKQAFDSVKGSLVGLSSYANSVSSSIGNLAGLGTALGAATFTEFIRGGIDTLDMLNDLSDRTGVAATTLAGFQRVALLSDTSLEAVGKGINKLSIFMAENAEQAKKLGLSAKEPADAFVQLAELLSGIEDTQQRAAVANKILGKSYQDLLPALLQGGEALRAQIAAGREFSGVTEEAVKEAGRFNDQMDLFKARVTNAGISLASSLLPHLNDAISTMSKLNVSARDFLLINPTTSALGGVFKALNEDNPANTLENFLKLNKKGQDEFKFNGETVFGKALSDINKIQKVDKKVIDQFINPIKAEKKAKVATKDPAIEEAARFVASLQKQVDTLDLSRSAMLSYEAAHLRLSNTQKQTVNGLIDVIAVREQLAKDDAAWAEQAKLNAAFDEEQLRMLEEASAAEIELNDEKQKSYEEMAAQLKTTNEDLNIDLIASDKARAKAQLDLEHARALERIEALGLEAEQAQDLIAQEAEHYQLQQKKIEQGLTKTKSISEELGVSFKSAFEDAVVGGEDFSDIIQGLEQDIVRLAARRTILDPLLKAFDTLLSGGGDSGGGGDIFSNLFSGVSSFFANAKGGVYTSPSLSQYSGGVYNTPQTFAFAKGAGVFAEAGPEAIMPLSRGADGKLGVKSSGTSGVNVVVNLIESPGHGGQVNQKQDGNNLTIDLMVEQIESMMGRNITKGRGISPQLERQYGLSRVAGAM